MKISIAVLSFLFVISGCSVVPNEFTSQEKEHAIKADALKIDKLSNLGEDPVFSLSDILARAVIFNKEREIASLEYSLAGLTSSQAYLDQLPSLVQRLSQDNRDNYSGSNSASFLNGELTEPTSESYLVSSKKNTFRSDLSLTMNLLDFGIAYGKAERLADELLIAREKERQAIQNIVQRTENTYWRVVAAQKLENKIEMLIDEALSAYNNNQVIIDANLQEPIQALSVQRELILVLRTLRDLRRDLSTAKVELDQLIGVRPGTEYNLVDVNSTSLEMPKPYPDNLSLETLALLNRSDLSENLYESRILQSEKDTAIMSLLPSIGISAGYYTNDSPYNLNDNWLMVTPSISWNLIDLFRLESVNEKIQLRKKLLEEQRLQITIGIFAVIDSSTILLEQNLERFELAQSYSSVTSSILTQLQNSVNVNRSGSLALIKEKLNLLLALHRLDLTYSEIRSTVGQTIQAVGLDLVPNNFSVISVLELSEVINKRLGLWYQSVSVNEGIEIHNRTQAIPVAGAIATVEGEASPVVDSSELNVKWSVQLYSAKKNQYCENFINNLTRNSLQPIFILDQHGFCKVRVGLFDNYEQAQSLLDDSLMAAADSIVVKTILNN